jgi:hypothetical protein
MALVTKKEAHAGFRVLDLGFRVEGLGQKKKHMQGLGFRIEGLGFRRSTCRG